MMWWITAVVLLVLSTYVVGELGAMFGDWFGGVAARLERRMFGNVE